MDGDHPIAGQLMGSHAADIAQGAKILVRLGYDVIDVNLACPVKKIRKKSRGGHLMSDPEQAIAVLDAARQATDPHIPCTVKLRRGTDDSVTAENNFRRIFEAAMALGYARRRCMGGRWSRICRPSRWGFLAEVVREYGLGGKRRSDGATKRRRKRRH